MSCHLSKRNDGHTHTSFLLLCTTPHVLQCLYRWGFRQVEKDFSSGKLIFKHKHFTRGDKKKCLAMHSIVNIKKPSAPSIIANISQNRRQGYSRLPNPNAGGVCVSNHLLQSNRHIYGGDNSIVSNLGNGGTYNMLDRRVSPSLSMNHGLRMQMQLPHSNYLNLNNGLNWTVPVTGLVQNRSDAQRPSATDSMIMIAALYPNQGHSNAFIVSQPNAGLRNIGRPAEEVNLAALIMNEDPTIDAWRALQLAKRHLNGTLATNANDLR